MKVAYYKEFSHELNRDMEFKVYGHAGSHVLSFRHKMADFMILRISV